MTRRKRILLATGAAILVVAVALAGCHLHLHLDERHYYAREDQDQARRLVDTIYEGAKDDVGNAEKTEGEPDVLGSDRRDAGRGR